MEMYFDVETYERDEVTGELKPVLNTNKMVLGCLYANKEYKYYTDSKKMREEIIRITKENKKKGRRTRLYAHNAAYDTLAIMKQDILNGDLELVREGYLIAKHKEGTIILDTKAIIDKRLELIGELLGKKKLEIPK